MTVTSAQILVVDDEPGIRLFLEEALTDEHYTVTTAEGVKAALRLLAEQTFDVALLDMRLGDGNGLDVLAAIQQFAPETVTILLTAHASLETAVQALRQGAHDYLFKPCKLLELRESVRRALHKRAQNLWQQQVVAQLKQTPPPPPPAADAADAQDRFLERQGLIVDFRRHVITLDGQLLELSPTEFNLLAYLVNASPRVVSPLELAREVQGYVAEGWEANDTVRYHIYRLRQKIQLATRRTDLIRNVRGIGYTLTETAILTEANPA